MTKVYVTKTTTEYTYDKEGRILKEVKTEENYEKEVTTPVVVSNPNGIFTKATGVPYPQKSTISYDSSISAVDCGATTSVQNAKSDTSGIAHNVNINASDQLPKGYPDVLSEIVKKALNDSVNASIRIKGRQNNTN